MSTVRNKILRALKEKYIRMVKKLRGLSCKLTKGWRDSSASDIARSRPLLAIVALLISLIIWALVAWDGNTEGMRTVDVPIKYTNLTPGFAIYESDENVQVRVIGRGNMLARMEAAELKAEVDLQSLQTGKYKLPIKIEIPEYLRLRSWSPAAASVEVYRQIERTLPLTWKLQGKPPARKMITNVEVTPNEATLTGPEAEVLAIQSLEVTIPADKLVSGVAQSLPVSADAGALANGRVRIAPDRVNVTVTLDDETVGEQIPVNVPVIGFPAEGFEIDLVKVIPDRVTIRGSGEAVRAISSLELSSIDVTGLDQNLQLILPLQPGSPVPGIEVIGPDRARVEIMLRKKIAAKTYSSVPIIVTGASPNVEWVITPASAALTVDGSQLMIDALFNNEPPCELYVDVSNVVARQITLPVLVRKLQKEFEVVHIAPEQVTVAIINNVN